MPFDDKPYSGTPLGINTKKSTWGIGNPSTIENIKLPDFSEGVFNIDTKAQAADPNEPISIHRKKYPSAEQVLNATTASLFGIDFLLSKQNDMLQQQNFLNRQRNIMQGSVVTNMDKNDQPIIMAKHGANIRRGNNSPSNNVNAEGGEFLQWPDLETEHIKGPSHEDGGVNLKATGRIFSDTLKPVGSKKTFAKLAKEYDVQEYLDILQDPFADRIEKHTAEIMLPRKQAALDKLFAMQQEMNGDSEGEEMSNGGKIKSYAGGGKIPYEEWKKTKSPVILDSELRRQYQEYVNTPEKQPVVEGAKPVETARKRSGNPTKDLYDLLSNDPKLKSIFEKEYRSMQPDDKASIDDILKTYYSVESHIDEVNKRVPQEVLLDPSLDMGKTNEAYNSLMKKYGFNPVGIEEGKKFQAAYRAIARLKSNKELAESLKDFDINPVGLPDQQFGENDYPNAPVSEISGYIGNTTLRQMVKYAGQTNTVLAPKSDAPAAESKPGNTYDGRLPKFQQTSSTMGRFPAYQMLPEISGFLGAMNTFPYWTPDYSHWEINPQELNIQPQLESIDSNLQSVIRENTGNPSVNFSRNAAMFNQSLQAKQQAFGQKQNYDANSRFQADQFNINARNREQELDINAANNIYNELFASAKDFASTERQAALSSATKKMADFYKDEFMKVNYYDTLFDNYYYDGRDKKHAVKLDPLAQENIQLTPDVMDYITSQAAEAKKKRTEKPTKTI